MGSVKFVISSADTVEVFYDSVCTSLWKFFLCDTVFSFGKFSIIVSSFIKELNFWACFL